MRLINVKVFLDLDAGKTRPDAKPLEEFNGLELTNTAYAILSHCWGDPEDEVQYMEMDSLAKIDVAGEMRKRGGYHKIRESCLQAFHDHLSWLWVDTCCIDKRSSAELSEAINSMYVWYANSDRCYAFLHDVDTNTLPAERDSIELNKFNGWPKWFSRGWTLQELIAPQDVHFFNRNWKCIANKRDSARALSAITRISVDVLEKGFSRSFASVAQIISWAADRTTTREEDRAYSLLGLFGVHMPMLYGEGKNAFLRLQLEVIRMINDQSIFAWRWTTPIGPASGFLATDPSHFRDCSSVVRMDPTDMLHTLKGYISKRRLRRLASAKERLQTFAVTNDGILIWLPLKRERRSKHSKFFSAMLACYNSGGKRKPITITIREVGGTHLRHFGWPPEVEDRTTSIEFKSILLPYRDNLDQVNIRGPSWMQSRRRLQIWLGDITPENSIIVVLGAPGSGKSNFINQLTGMPPEPSADFPTACAKTVIAFSVVHKGKSFVFIDTPPLHGSYPEVISEELGLLHWRSIKLAGVIYTFNLSDGWTGEDERGFQTVLTMCGESAFDILRLVCTMWDEVDSGNRTQVTNKVKNRFSKVLGEGVRYEEFKNTPASAWAIVEGFGDEKKVLLDQRRMVDGRNDLQKTSRLKRICSRCNTIFTSTHSQTNRIEP